ncbi:MAG: hypothetical protein IPK82_23445 [Polyangiaceae bacterium]|nr:hypothetical protein [Polyangiaceae bacterium]
MRAARAFDAALAFVLDQTRLDSQCRTLILYGPEDCNRLLLLLPRLHRISQDTADLIWADEASLKTAQNNLRYGLADLAAYALIWATTGQPNYVRGCKGIAAARLLYDHQLVLGDRHTDCTSPTTPHSLKFRVLFEQCGEIAHVIDQVQHHGLAPGNIHVELIQVAAVCVAWLESYELSREGAKGAKAKA